MRITERNPVRKAVGEFGTYHTSPAAALGELTNILAAHDIRICADLASFPDPQGYTTFRLSPIGTDNVVCDCCAEKIDRKEFDNCLVFTHYKMREGRYEIVTYIS